MLGRQGVKFTITRATKGSREEAVFTAHEARSCSLNGAAAFLSLQSEEEELGREYCLSLAFFEKKNPYRFD